MIILDEDKDYFILIDEQGASFAAGCIFEGIEDVAEKFKDWASADSYEDPTLKGWSIGDCLENWSFALKVYYINDFIEVEYKQGLENKFLNFIL